MERRVLVQTSQLAQSTACRNRLGPITCIWKGYRNILGASGS